MSKILPPEEFILEHVRLRRPRPSDAEAVFEYGSDPKVAFYADWPIRTSMDGLAESLSERAKLWEAGSQFSWVITLLAEDRAIGRVTTNIHDQSADIGYLLNRRYWGNGYAAEATRPVIDWLLSLPSITKVWATCDTENIASIRVLEKLGFSRESRMLHSIVRPQISKKPRDAYLYSLTKLTAEGCT